MNSGLLYLRSLIRECILLEDRGKLGDYVFADQRSDTPHEPNTPLEDQLASALERHYHGRPHALIPLVDELLASKEDYPEFFEPPRRYRKAYRTITIPEGMFSSVIGRQPNDEDRDGEIHVENGTTIGPYEGRNFFSWTLDPGIFYGLKKDWGSLYSTNWVKSRMGGKGYVMFLSALTDQNDFVMNPFEVRKTHIAGEFAYQMEVLGIGDIKLDLVSYFYFDDKMNPDLETQLISDAINAIT